MLVKGKNDNFSTPKYLWVLKDKVEHGSLKTFIEAAAGLVAPQTQNRLTKTIV